MEASNVERLNSARSSQLQLFPIAVVRGLDIEFEPQQWGEINTSKTAKSIHTAVVRTMVLFLVHLAELVGVQL